MNVQGLIDELQKIEDKEKVVILSQGSMAFTGIQFDRSEVDIVGETDLRVWISNSDGSVEKYREKYGDRI